MSLFLPPHLSLRRGAPRVLAACLLVAGASGPLAACHAPGEEPGAVVPPVSEAAPAALPAPPPADEVAAPPDTLSAWTTAPTRRDGPTAPPVATLRAVRSATHEGFDRVVFAFSTHDKAPGLRVGYEAAPVRCGSGEAVAVPGRALLVSVQPAAAHDERGSVTAPPHPVATGLSAVTALVQTCDFEGEVAWALGVDGERPYRVFTLANPARVVVDVQR